LTASHSGHLVTPDIILRIALILSTFDLVRVARNASC